MLPTAFRLFLIKYFLLFKDLDSVCEKFRIQIYLYYYLLYSAIIQGVILDSSLGKPQRKIFFSGPVTKRGREKAGPLRKKTFKIFFFLFSPIDNSTHFMILLLIMFSDGKVFLAGLSQYLEKISVKKFLRKFVCSKSVWTILRQKKYITTNSLSNMEINDIIIAFSS